MGLIILIPIALLVLTVLVVVHEFGHFIMAKRAGVWVEEFGVGLPPRIWGKKFGETIYSINALPLGGFVRLHGETDEGVVGKPKRAYVNKSAKARIVISLAGIVMNVLFAFLCFSVVYSFNGIKKERDLGYVKVYDIIADSPAKEAGMQVGDIIRKVDGKDVPTTETFIQYVSTRANQRIKLEVERKINEESKKVILNITPKEDPKDKTARIGVGIGSTETYVYYPPYWQRPIVGAWQGVQDTWNLTKQIVLGLTGIAGSLSHGEVPKDVGGPVTIVLLLTEVIKQGVFNTLWFAGAISLNLAIFNVLPFPPLDGSRVLFTILEKLFGKKMVPQLESKIHTIGFIILLILVVLISAKEIPSLFRSGSVPGYIQSLTK